MTKASLTRTILRKSKLQGANLTGVGDLAEANLKGAEFDSKTVFPDGFSKEDAKREGMREVTLTSPSSQCVEKKSSNT